jgi:predicted  nucleic acid-binding Zn-ribbon protein
MFFFWRTKKESPEALVEDALSGFNAAVEKMNTATAQIESAIVNHEVNISEIQKKITEAQEAKSRITRISEKFKELLA